MKCVVALEAVDEKCKVGWNLDGGWEVVWKPVQPYIHHFRAAISENTVSLEKASCLREPSGCLRRLSESREGCRRKISLFWIGYQSQNQGGQLINTIKGEPLCC